MVSFTQLRDLNVANLRSLGDTFSQLASRLSGRGDDLSRQANYITAHWEGGAASSAKTTLHSLLGEIDATDAPLKEIDRVMSSVADDLQRAKGMLLDAIDAAKKIPASISDDGTVTYTGPEVTEEQRPEIDKKIQSVRDDIEAALSLAGRADETGATALASLVPGFDPDNPNAGYVPASDIPDPDADAATVNRWWNSLTPAQQQYLIHHHPELIGNLNGIPILARDQANRVYLAQEMQSATERKQQLEDRRAALLEAGRYRPLTTLEMYELSQISSELNLIERNLRGMNAISERLYHPDPGEPPAYLIGFAPGTKDGDVGDDGRAIVAIGNPDTADHVATFVPGTGADLNGIGGIISRADVMHRDALDLDPNADTAVIAWLGYDAPDELHNAVSKGYAENATDDLRSFQSGLAITHEDDSLHRTVVGHSYGSTVVGFTARGDGLPTEDVIFVGSPGVGVDHASELNGVSPDHVWAIRAGNDPIKYVPDFWFGRDPVSDDFGGRVIHSEDVGHSGYWSDDATSAREGMAAVITGNEELLLPGAGGGGGGGGSW